MAQRRKAKRGRRIPLTRERVITAALELADEHGVDALSMRKLGAALGVEAMALYNHVRNKDEILDALVDGVFSEVELSDEKGPWRAEMRKRALGMQAALLRPRWATGLLESRTNPGPENLRHHNAVLGCLRHAGFDPATAVHAYSALDSYIYGFALQQHTLPFETPAQQRALVEHMLTMLPADEYPHLREVATDLIMVRGFDHAEEFAYGLDLILDGLERALAATEPPRAP